MSLYAVLIVLPDRFGHDEAEGFAADVRGSFTDDDWEPVVVGWPPEPHVIRRIADQV